MKKLLILLFIPFILSGCYDYNELNDLAIISGVGIDYEDEEYVVTFEILSTKKSGETSGATSSYTVKSKGKTITEAFLNNGNLMDKVPYYDHVDVVIISEDVAKNYFEDVAEFIIRGSQFRNEIYLAIAKDAKAEDIMKATSKEKPVASLFMAELLEHSMDSSSAGYYEAFTKTLSSILTKGEDAIAPVFSLKNKEIVLKGMGIFKDFKMQGVISNDEAAVVNLLKNFKTTAILFEHYCSNDKKTVISIYQASIDINPNNENVKISGTLNGRIYQDSCGYNLKETKSYEELQNIFTKVITNKMDNVINIMKSYESNALNIGKAYYNKYRIEATNKWINQDIIYDLNLKINKKGLIFEVENEK